jgi:urease accessory protein
MIELFSKTEDAGGTPYTTLTLPFELRQKSRQRVMLDNGEEASVILRRGTVLYDQDLLLAQDKKVVRIIAAEERLSCVSCRDPLLFARLCYHLGNRHVLVQIEQGKIYYLHDHVLDDMIKNFGLGVTHLMTPFCPEQGAYSDPTKHHHEY